MSRKMCRWLPMQCMGDLARIAATLCCSRGTPPSRADADPEAVVGEGIADKANQLRLRRVLLAPSTGGRILPLARRAKLATAAAAIDARSAALSVGTASFLRWTSTTRRGCPQALPGPASFSARARLLELGRTGRCTLAEGRRPDFGLPGDVWRRRPSSVFRLPSAPLRLPRRAPISVIVRPHAAENDPADRRRAVVNGGQVARPAAALLAAVAD